MTRTLRDRLAEVLGPGNDDATAYRQADAVLDILNAEGHPAAAGFDRDRALGVLTGPSAPPVWTQDDVELLLDRLAECVQPEAVLAQVDEPTPQGVTLTPEEAVRVLRLHEWQIVKWGDGAGWTWRCRCGVNDTGDAKQNPARFRRYATSSAAATGAAQHIAAALAGRLGREAGQ